MRKILRSVLIVFLCYVLTVSVFSAETAAYQIDNLGICIDIPSEYVVFTREIDANDPNLSTYGLTKDNMLSFLETNNIYLDCWDNDVTFEITVIAEDIFLEDFNQFSDADLLDLASSLAASYEEEGIMYLRSEVYQHDQAKFLKIYSSGQQDERLQYQTVYANKAVYVTLCNYVSTIDASQESNLKSIVDSIYFESNPMETETPMSTPAFTYVDDETGVMFTVPANWTEGTTSEGHNLISAKFTSNLEPGFTMLYANTDLWAELSAEEQSGNTRSDIDNSIFSEAAIAEMFDVDTEDITLVSYGGKEYFKIVVTDTISTSGLQMTMTNLFRIENGYIYMFQFSGDSDSSCYADFESLLNSVAYPKVADTASHFDPAAPPSSTHAASSADLSYAQSEFRASTLLLSLLSTVLIYALPIYIYRYGIRKAPLEKKKAKKIVIIYGIAAFFLMSCLIFVTRGSGAASGAIVLWSWINYRVLTGGPANIPVSHAGPSKESALPESAPDPKVQEPADAAGERLRYCVKCGAALSPYNKFCHQCGAEAPEASNAQHNSKD